MTRDIDYLALGTNTIIVSGREPRFEDFMIAKRGAATKTLGFVGKKGSGKTWASAVWVEELLERKIPVVILDPVGRWWDLGLAPDGRSPGYPVAVFGGKHGQVPLTKDIGAAIARYVATRHVPTVVDLSSEHKSTWRRVVADFCDELFKVNELPVHVVIEEAPEFIPQRVFGESAVVFGAVDRLVRLGRNRGIGVTVIGQRLQTINKDTLSQVDALVLMRILDPQGRKAAREWVEGKGGADETAGMFGELASLPTGTGFIWSPEWLEKFARVRFAARRSFHFDPEQAPDVKDSAIARAVDTTELLADFASFAQPQAQAPEAAPIPWLEDPIGKPSAGKKAAATKAAAKAAVDTTDLRRQVASLTEALALAQSQIIGQDELEDRIFKAAEAKTISLQRSLASLEVVCRTFISQANALLSPDDATGETVPPGALRLAGPQAVAAYIAKHKEYFKLRAETRVLDALAEYYLRFGLGMTLADLATDLGYHPRSKSFRAALAKLTKRRVLVKDGETYHLNPAHLR